MQLTFSEIVALTVQFNNQAKPVAAKIRNVRPNWSLPPKLHAIQVMGFDVAPEQNFSTSHSAAKGFRLIPLPKTDGRMCHAPPSLTLPHKGGGNDSSSAGD